METVNNSVFPDMEEIDTAPSAPEEITSSEAAASGDEAVKLAKPPVNYGVKVGKIIGKVFFYLALAVLCVLFLFPVWWMIMNSMKTGLEVEEAMNSWKSFLPSFNAKNWFTSYGKMFTSQKLFARSILNSIIYCVVSILGILIVNSLAGYALTRLVFPGHKVIVTVILLLLIVPVETSVVSTYVILDSIGLTKEEGAMLGYVLPGLASPMYIFMFRSYFMGIPKELEEAAAIDGCGKLRTFFRVIMPCCLPVFATVAIFAFMGQWNEYVFAGLLFNNRKDLMPLQYFLQIVNTSANQAPEPSTNIVMAALTFSTIPIALVYIFCQRYIVEGVAFSGLK